MIFSNFDSRKLVSLAEYWKPIRSGVIPPPIAMSLDLGNKCQNDCFFCNAKRCTPDKEMDVETFAHVIDFLNWAKTKSVCVAGGKESLTNPDAAWYISRIIKETGAAVGLITNGVKYVKLDKLRFLNVSVNAGDAETYKKVCGADHFRQVCANILKWVDDGQPVTYKVMVTNRNKGIDTFVKSAEMAASLGCKTLLFRYAGNPWFDMDKESMVNISEIEIEAMCAAVNALKNKYGDLEIEFPIDRTDRYSVKATPKTCAGCKVNVVVTADGEVFGCSDHRGNKDLHYCHISRLKDFWGSRWHTEKIAMINPAKCPRCSFYQHSVVLDEFVYNDASNQYFI